jgi:hypothetical protein
LADTFTNNFNFIHMLTTSDSGVWGDNCTNFIFLPLDIILGGTLLVPMPASSDFNLSTTQWQNKAFKLSGALLANVNLILPLSVNSVGSALGVGGEFVVWNTCTGNFTVTVKTAATGSTGVVVPQGLRSVLYSDTVNVWRADDGLITQASIWASLAPNIGLETFIDGQGSAITTGNHGTLEVPFNCTLTSWTCTNNLSGGSNGIATDVWRANGQLPTSSAQSIVGTGNGPGVGGGGTYLHAAASGWTSTALIKGDILIVNVTAVTNCTQSLVSLNATRTGS